MASWSPRAFVVLAGLVCPAVAGAQVAPPKTRAACIDASASGQILRNRHKLVEAGSQFNLCAIATCPAAIQRDCATWSAEIEPAIPTIVLSAKDAQGTDVVDVRVSMDERELATKLDGASVAVDPGFHAFRFERSDGTVTRKDVLVKEGEKAQQVSVIMPSVSSVGRRAIDATARPEPSRWSSLRIASLVAAGAGVVGVAAGVGLALNAKAEDRAAKSEAGALRHTDSISAANQGTVASAVVGVSAAVFAGGVVLWFVAPGAHTTIGWNGRQALLRTTW